jgi:lipoprotein-anchoring transpeptidase ErfK/SrfK
VRSFALALAGLAALSLGGCVTARHDPSARLDASTTANWTPRDREFLTNAPHAHTPVPVPYQRHLVDYHRKEAPGTIVVESDDRYLYYVLPEGKALRYGVTVGEEALAWSGVATIGRMQEWPAWVPTQEIKQRLANIPDYVKPGAHNPLGARALYLYQDNKDTLFRIHGTNQPEYIGRAISSGCIRMTNEDAIDLFNRVKIGTPVVVLPPGRGPRLFSFTAPAAPPASQVMAASAF